MWEGTTSRWESLELVTSTLFLVASVILFATAMYRGVAYVVESFAFDQTLGNFMLFGRLAVILAIGGLSVQVANRSPRLGKLTRWIVLLGAVFTVVLFVLAVLDSLGAGVSSMVSVFGLGTFVLSVLTYGVGGASILRTGAYSTVVGGLLVTAAGILLVIFAGLMVYPTGVVGTLGEGALAVIYLVIAYRLRTEPKPTDRAEPAPTEAGHD